MADLGAFPAAVLSVLIIALSAFFVAVEFALVGARTHRLEEAARTSVAARAALRSSRDISLLLAGSQLGITLCLVALGAIAKPAVHHALTPALELVGAPYLVADVAGFVLALVVVTFLHLVVGEMAPKSWAISHPERSAIMLALPMRAFMWLTRPVIVALNGMANWCLWRVGVEPVDEVAHHHGPDELSQLVNHSAKAGALDEERRQQLTAALTVNARSVAEVVTPVAEFAGVTAETSSDAVRAVARETGHLRLLVRRGDTPVGVLHVRDTLSHPDATAAELMTNVPSLDGTRPIYQVLTQMRESHAHLALVVDDAGDVLGLVTLQDLVDELLAAQEQR